MGLGATVGAADPRRRNDEVESGLGTDVSGRVRVPKGGDPKTGRRPGPGVGAPVTAVRTGSNQSTVRAGVGKRGGDGSEGAPTTRGRRPSRETEEVPRQEARVRVPEPPSRARVHPGRTDRPVDDLGDTTPTQVPTGTDSSRRGVLIGREHTPTSRTPPLFVPRLQSPFLRPQSCLHPRLRVTTVVTVTGTPGRSVLWSRPRLKSLSTTVVEGPRVAYSQDPSNSYLSPLLVCGDSWTKTGSS